MICTRQILFATKNETGALRINATLKRVRVTIIAVQKATSFTYYVCVWSLRYLSTMQCSCAVSYYLWSVRL
jgi:hypothetical protein